MVGKVLGASIDLDIHLDRDTATSVSHGPLCRQALEVLALMPALHSDFSTQPLLRDIFEGRCVIHVTHDHEEARSIADLIALFYGGPWCKSNLRRLGLFAADSWIKAFSPTRSRPSTRRAWEADVLGDLRGW